jgi:hypothetical protein
MSGITKIEDLKKVVLTMGQSCSFRAIEINEEDSS